MPTRSTKRGRERTSLGGDRDVIICGASFAGLAVARELAGSGARVILLDRYEIGERQTSACAAPTEWLEAMGVAGSIRQTFPDLVIHTPHASVRMRLPFSFSTFDYPTLCRLLFEGTDAEFETATVQGRVDGGHGNGSARPLSIATDRGELTASLIVDCLGWRRLLDDGYQPPEAPLSRALEVHPEGGSTDLEVWIERAVVPAGYGWSFPAADELRVGVGSFDPRHHVKRPTVGLAERLDLPSVRYQGNWIPHQLRQATSRGMFFCGDSAGHALPLTAEGIRTAFYFGIACGRELRRVIAGRASVDTALRRYAAFSDRHRWQFDSLLRVQRLVPRIPPRALALALRGMSRDRFVNWAFGHYFDIAHPAYARAHAARPAAPAQLHAAA